MDAERARIIIWEKLRPVAKPDSRFSWDFSDFITDYEGSEKHVNLITSTDEYKKSKVLFITPDNNLEYLREQVITDKKVLIMTNYGIKRGFFVIKPGDVPQGKEEVASLLDGAQRYWKHYTLKRLKEEFPHVDMMITGASAITPSGIRFGKGHGYFDLEWAMFYTKGIVDDSTSIWAVGHDCQVFDLPVEVLPHDTAIDYIVTTTEIIKTRNEYTRPTGGVIWSMLQPEMLGEIPPLQELWAEIACK